MKKQFFELAQRIERCGRCARLRKHCIAVAQRKKRAHRDDCYWGKPVEGFGDPSARIWIIGLAPGAHGANRTGRMFTGDSSGLWLYRALFETGFSNREVSQWRGDGLKLTDVYVSAAARCAPPDNKPTPTELARCAPYLDEEWELLKHVEIFLPLGAIAFEALLRLFTRKKISLPTPKPRFSHASLFHIDKYQVLSSYHPSRQNTQTGRLTQAMWRVIFVRARGLLENHAAGEGDVVGAFDTNIVNVPNPF